MAAPRPDRDMDCAAIFAAVQANNAKLQEMGVVGLVIIWPFWFGTDFQGTANTGATAVNRRQQHLAALAEERQCVVPPPGQPQAPPPK